ncbi:MAG: reverse transcriptase family protein [Marinoscillum sp.]
MNSSLFEKKQLKHLAFTLKCKPTEILNLCSNIEKSYGHRYEVKENKATGKVKTYSDGTVKKRPINTAYGRLEELQKRIKNQIFRKIKFPEHIQGGVKGKTNISNAKAHQGKKYILTTDLSDCFPNVSSRMVNKAFLDLGYSDIQATWLTKLTTYNHCLPQGTRTSPYLANLCLLPLDFELLKFSKRHGITYTRYVDDLTFSSPEDFTNVISEIIDTIIGHNMKISWRKTIYSGKQNITGIDIYNNYIDATEKLKEKARQEISSNSEYKPISDYISRIHRTNTGVIKVHNKH